MAITIKDIFKLDSLTSMKIVAGDEGIEKQVEWVYVAECFEDPLEGIQWLQGGELVFITGSKMKGNLSYIARIVEGISEKNASGLLVNIGPYIDNIPKEAIDVANDLKIPVMTIPWNVKLIDISKEITNKIILSTVEEGSLTNFLSNMLFSDGDVTGDARKKMTYFGYDLDGKCAICVMDIDKFQLYLEERNIFDEAGVIKVKVIFKRIVDYVLKKHGFKVPIIDKDDALILFLKDDKNYMNRIEKILIEIQETLRKEMDNISVSIGIGSSYENLNMMKSSLKEAELSIKYLKCNGYDSKIKKYDEIGVYKLLFNIEDKAVLENFYYGTLGPILENDKKIKEVNNIKILETYFNEDCNVTSTAEKLFLHRNTLKYRIKKVEELLECDLRNFNDCNKLKMAIEIGKIIKLYL